MVKSVLKQLNKQFLIFPEIVPRLQQYQLNQDINDIEGTVEALQKLYPEYSKVRKESFRQLVIKGVRFVTKQLEPRSSKPYLSFEEINQGSNKQKRKQTNDNGLDPNEVHDERDPTKLQWSDMSCYQDNLNEQKLIQQSKFEEENNRQPKRMKLGDDSKSNSQDINNNKNADYSKQHIKDLKNQEASQLQNIPFGKGKQPLPKIQSKAIKQVQRKQENKQSFQVDPLKIRFEDFGGIENIIEEIQEIIGYPLCYPQLYRWLGVRPPQGVLMVGPPGCGKTALCNAIAYHYNLPFFKVSAPEIVSGMSGESEQKLRDLFEQAQQHAPCVVFIDEIDAIMPKRETAQREMERRIVAQMLTCLDSLNEDIDNTEENQEDLVQNNTDKQEDANILQNTTEKINLVPDRHVVVMAATNRPESLDPALRRAGRFDRELLLGIPNEVQRSKILEQMTKNKRLQGHFDFKEIGRLTPGYVGADLEALIKEAATISVKRIISKSDQQQNNEVQENEKGLEIEDSKQLFDLQQKQLQKLLRESQESQNQSKQVKSEQGVDPMEICTPETTQQIKEANEVQQKEGYVMSQLAISMDDFRNAVKKVQPNLKREGFSTAPNVTWGDIGALQEVRGDLSFWITQPISQPGLFASMGLSRASGVLLFGPPGCGKTLLAKAVANEARANFISIKGPELLNKYVGESEKAVRQLFSRARQAQPCVLFFDEIDSMAPKRGSDSNQQSERVVNQLLTELDGANDRDGVWVVAASNRPDILDPALLRPGRLDKLLYVPLPGERERGEILRTIGRSYPISKDIDLALIGQEESLSGYSGADLSGLVREAAVISLKESLNQKLLTVSKVDPKPFISEQHFIQAKKKVRPSVSKQDQLMYLSIKNKILSSLESG